MEYWIWLQRALGAGGRADELLGYFGSPKAFFDAGKREWILSGVISHDAARRLEAATLEEAHAVAETCRKNGWSILTPESPYYPRLLHEIPAYPIVLYVQGDVRALSAAVPIAFVGTRNASRYGLDVSFRLARDVAQSGALVVSGAALGVDSSSHRGALAAGKPTVAILGCGFGHSYLKENEDLRREIANNGALVSEFQPFSPPTKATFPIRNRLISGMSLGTVVIEAGIRSGSLITAGCASRQGRDVFAVPGDIITSNHTGANKLIRDGAKPVFAPEDILEEYAALYPQDIHPHRAAQQKQAEEKKPEHSYNSAFCVNTYTQTVRAKRALPQNMRPALQSVYAALDASPKTADTLSEENGLPIFEILSLLTELELHGYAQNAEGGAYTAVFE